MDAEKVLQQANPKSLGVEQIWRCLVLRRALAESKAWGDEMMGKERETGNKRLREKKGVK